MSCVLLTRGEEFVEVLSKSDDMLNLRTARGETVSKRLTEFEGWKAEVAQRIEKGDGSVMFYVTGTPTFVDGRLRNSGTTWYV